eukprot:m.75806 g.75806  ORF g.75806 m.75806 type:complete len:835 (-) comp13145_c0_seq4:25-2529(-)
MFAVQRQAFAADERLLAMVAVLPSGRLRNRLTKHNLICLTVTKNLVTVHKIRVQADTKGEVYSKRRAWALDELKMVDGVNTNAENKDFILVLDKSYPWTVLDAAEKTPFLFSLWKLCGKYLDGVPQFVNVNFSEPDRPPIDTELYPLPAMMSAPKEPVDAPPEDCKDLTAAEERDVALVLADHDWALRSADQLSADLAREIESHESANVHAILSGEREVNKLVEEIDKSLEALSRIESTVEAYENALKRVRKDVYKVAEQEKALRQENKNYERLTDDVRLLVSQLDLPYDQEDALTHPDFETARGVHASVAAATALQAKMQITLKPGMSALAVVQERTSHFNQLAANFAMTLVKYCKQLIAAQAKEHAVERTAALALPDHAARFEECVALGPLLAWLHGADPESRYSRFAAVGEHYCKTMNPVYLRDIKTILENLKTAVSGRAGKTAEDQLTKHLQFSEAFGRVLGAIVAAANAEQGFIEEFFGLAPRPAHASSRQSLALEANESSSDPAPRSARAASADSATALDLTRDVFTGLEAELLHAIDSAHRIDEFNALPMFVRVERHLSSGRLCSFLTALLGRCLVVVKRLVDGLLEGKVLAMANFKLSGKKSHVGILPFVTQTAELIRHIEEIHGSDRDRHTVVVKVYTTLLDNVFANIERVAADCKHQDVVIFENCRILSDLLSRLKVECLKPYRPLAADKYRKHLDQYVQAIIGDPLEKITTFFDGVQQLIASGVPMAEVGFQFAYSKQELRARLKDYPGKEVRKGIEQMYKRVERHLCDEANLRVVVLRAMQEEFVNRYKHFESLMQSCYPGAQIKFEFTENELMSFFLDYTK